MYLGVSKGKCLPCVGVTKCLTATRRLPPHPRNSLKPARKERARLKQPPSPAPGAHGAAVPSALPKEGVGARETLAAWGQSSPNQECPPAPFPSGLLLSNHREAICLQFTADVLYSILSVYFPQNCEHRQKPKLTLLHFSIPT